MEHTHFIERTYDFQFNAIDHYNKTRGFYSDITMTSKAFAAHSPIHVIAKVSFFTNQTLSDGTSVREAINSDELDAVYVVFPRSHLNNEPVVEFHNPKPGGAITATFGANGKPYWYGEGDIKYEMQGSYILGITSRPVEVIEEQDTVRDATFINIASEEVVSRMNADQLTMGLTFAIMGLAVITIIPVINSIMVYAQRYDDEKHQLAQAKKSQNQTSPSK